MSFSAEISNNRFARPTQRDRRIGAGESHPDARLARGAWQCLALGVLAFIASRTLSSTAANASDGAIWLVLAPLVSLLALYRHRLGASWARRAPVAAAYRSAAGARGPQSRLPRRAPLRLRRAA